MLRLVPAQFDKILHYQQLLNSITFNGTSGDCSSTHHSTHAVYLRRDDYLSYIVGHRSFCDYYNLY